MTPGSLDIAGPLRHRADQYRRWFIITAPTAALSLAYAWALWTPPPGADLGFRHVDIPRELVGLWQAQVSQVSPPPAFDLMALFDHLSLLVFVAAAAAILAGIVKRRHPAALAAPAVIALIGLVFAGAAHVDNRDGYRHARLEDATPARVQALQSAAKKPPTDTLDGISLPQSGYITGADLTRLDGRQTHSLQIGKPQSGVQAGVQGPVQLYVDGRPVSLAPGTPPDTAVAVAHYTAAQVAYLRRDPATTRRELEAISPRAMPLHPAAGWRIGVMREWVAAKHQPATMQDQDFIGAGTLGLDLQRWLAWGLALAGSLLAPLSLALAALILTLHRRMARIEQLTAKRPPLAERPL